jgi:hypothetical protein
MLFASLVEIKGFLFAEQNNSPVHPKNRSDSVQLDHNNKWIECNIGFDYT